LAYSISQSRAKKKRKKKKYKNSAAGGYRYITINANHIARELLYSKRNDLIQLLEIQSFLSNFGTSSHTWLYASLRILFARAAEALNRVN